jgi:hypothetical protein
MVQLFGCVKNEIKFSFPTMKSEKERKKGKREQKRKKKPERKEGEKKK